VSGSILGLLVALTTGGGPTHRVVVDLNMAGTVPFKATLETVRNLRKAMAPSPVEVEIVCRGPAVSQLLKTSTLATRVDKAAHQGVRFVACGNTLKALHLHPSSLVPGVTVVDAGVAELVRKQEAGWAYLKGG
jgi:uncharacterized protein